MMGLVLSWQSPLEYFQCLVFLCEILEKCETSLGGMVFEGIQDSSPALEALLQGCTLDEALLKTLEGTGPMLTVN